MNHCLILFDIDGTMLDTGGAGIEALKQGFMDAFPDTIKKQPFPELELGGATDGGIFDYIRGAYGAAWSSADEEHFYQCYLERLKPALETSYHSQLGHKLPGVAALLDHFIESHHSIGLLTGNIQRAAQLKLDTFEFGSHHFVVGAYGDDHSDRNKLGPIAIERAENTFRKSFHPENQVFILGDTLKDIACARACGAKVIAVATGACDYTTLAIAKPDYLFRDFEDYHSVLLAAGL